MSVTYETTAIPSGNHASIAVPDTVLAELGATRRAPLRVTVNGHTYQSTATAVDGECRVVFPSADRAAAGVTGGDAITVTLELDAGHREVKLHPELDETLVANGLRDYFEMMAYSHRKQFARAVADAKSDDTRARRVRAAIDKVRERRDASK